MQPLRRGCCLCPGQRQPRGQRQALCSDPSSAVTGRAWGDERRGIPWTMTGLLSEFAFAFSTHEDNDADGTEDSGTDEPADPETVPVVVERTVFVFRVIGVQGRQACQEQEQAQGHLLHVGALALWAHQAERGFGGKQALPGRLLPLSTAATP